jgi:hypothetical protein
MPEGFWRIAVRATGFVVAAVLIVGSAIAGAFEDGVTAFDRKDYAKALLIWQPLAEEGDPWAQGSLGLLYLEGYGVPIDYEKALHFFVCQQIRETVVRKLILG